MDGTRSGTLGWQDGPEGRRLVLVDAAGPRRRVPQPDRALVEELRDRAPSDLEGMRVDYEWVKGQVRHVRPPGAPVPAARPRPPSPTAVAAPPRGGAVRDVDVFRNPYTFVPAPERPDGDGPLCDRPPAGHDLLLDDHWTGRIGVGLTTVTPLLLLDTARAVPDGDGHATYDPLLRDGVPHLPATAVKGMLRAAYEAATNSRLGVFTGHDSPLGYRMSAREGLAVVPARISDDGRSVELLTGTAPLGQRSGPQAVMYAAWLPRYRRAGSDKRRPPDPASNVAYPDGRPPRHGDHVRVRMQMVQHHRWDARRQEHVPDFRFWQVTAIAPHGQALPPAAPVAGSRERRPRASFHEPLPGTWTADGWACVGNGSFARKHDERVFFGTPQSRPLTKTLRERWTDLVRDYRAAHRHADLRERKDPRTRKTVDPWVWIDRDPGKTAWSRHLYEEGAEHLRGGDLCYARLDAKGQVQALYPVMIARELFAASPAALLHPSLRPARTLAELSPADRVFGWVNQAGAGAYRGQLRVGPVTFDGGPDDVARFDGGGVPLAILGQPKPQQGRFYAGAGTAAAPRPLPDRTPKRDWYVPGRTLRGRKVYLHHAGLPTTYWRDPTQDRTQQLDGGRYQEYRQPRKPPDDGGLTPDRRAFAVIPGQEQRSDQNRSVTGWVPEGRTFRATLEVRNLSRVELGALLWLLRLPEGAVHRLGLGKPLGFGSVCVEIEDAAAGLRTGADWKVYYSTFGDEPPGVGPDVEELVGEFRRATAALWPGEPHLHAFLAAATGDPSTPVHYPRVRPADMDLSVPVPPDPRGQSFAWFVQNEQERANELLRGVSLPPATGGPLPVHPAADRGGPPRDQPARRPAPRPRGRR